MRSTLTMDSFARPEAGHLDRRWRPARMSFFLRRTRNYSARHYFICAHLDRPYPDKVREGIARALAVPESRSR